ncbi:MAG TPA: HAMP domain-containing sensor histidine kinase [Gemmatimonadaceae bacterium]|nr:HAMP domain-containing sensor histidine kinase [Gemmatimonadaceae bacterium]
MGLQLSFFRDRHGVSYSKPHLAITGILGAIFVLVAVLTVQSWRAARRQDALTRQALVDRAAFAAASYRSRVEADLYLAAMASLRQVADTGGLRGPDPDALRRVADAAVRCRCVTIIPGRSYFTLDLLSGKLRVSPAESASTALSAASVREISRHALKSYLKTWQFGFLAGEPMSAGQDAFYRVIRSPAGGEPVRAYGFVVDSTLLRLWIFEHARRYAELMPPTGEHHESAGVSVSLAVFTRHGDLLYRSGPAYPPVYSARASLSAYLDSMVIEAALNPASAVSEWAGPTGGASFSLLATLLACTAALLIAALFLSWRTTELARLRADFTSSVSHELRTPLTQMLLYAETLSLGRTRSLSEGREIGRVVARETRRLIQLVENTLQFDRSGRRLRTVSPRVQHLAPLVRTIVGDFTTLLTAHDVAIVLDLDEGVHAAVDADALRQVLTNLLDNAVRYGPGSQTIDVRLHPSGEVVRLSVSDEGCGIPEHERSRVWNPYVRLNQAADAGSAGTGIGLAIVRDLASQHGGTVGITACDGEGACVFVDLPLPRLEKDLARHARNGR